MGATTAHDDIRVSGAELGKFATAVLSKIGMPDEDAALAAEAMVWSDLRGAPRHGSMSRLTQLAERARDGGLNLRPGWTLLRETTNSAVLDAEGGWGQVGGARGMQLAIAKARGAGIGMTSVRNLDIVAALGWYPTLAARERMVGLVISHTFPFMAPWGGTEKILGNQPFAVAVPAGRHFPILFDSVVATMSGNGMELAHERGERLPEGVAVNEHGEPTVDPEEALAGRVLPMGGHRGYGLALIWEVLTGVLSGGRMGPELGGIPMGGNMFCLAIDPAASIAYEDFIARVDELLDRIGAVPPMAGVDRVRIPGERGFQCALNYEREGIPVPPKYATRLRKLADELDVPWPFDRPASD